MEKAYAKALLICNNETLLETEIIESPQVLHNPSFNILDVLCNLSE